MWPTPPEPLGERADLCAMLPTHGTALDVACGLGAQTLWLAARGLDVTALDVSPIAVDRLRDAARATGLDDRVIARCVDLSGGLPAESPTVNVVLCQRFRVPELYPLLVDRLAPGGIGIVTVLSAVGASGAVGPFHAPAGELSAAFSRHDIDTLDDTEGSGCATVVFRKRS